MSLLLFHPLLHLLIIRSIWRNEIIRCNWTLVLHHPRRPQLHHHLLLLFLLFIVPRLLCAVCWCWSTPAKSFSLLEPSSLSAPGLAHLLRKTLSLSAITHRSPFSIPRRTGAAAAEHAMGAAGGRRRVCAWRKLVRLTASLDESHSLYYAEGPCGESRRSAWRRIVSAPCVATHSNTAQRLIDLCSMVCFSHQMPKIVNGRIGERHLRRRFDALSG